MIGKMRVMSPLILMRQFKLEVESIKVERSGAGESK